MFYWLRYFCLQASQLQMQRTSWPWKPGDAWTRSSVGTPPVPCLALTTTPVSSAVTRTCATAPAPSSCLWSWLCALAPWRLCGWWRRAVSPVVCFNATFPLPMPSSACAVIWLALIIFCVWSLFCWRGLENQAKQKECGKYEGFYAKCSWYLCK